MKFNSHSITEEESNVANLSLAGSSPCVMIFLTMGQVLLPCDAYCMENTTCVSLILFWSTAADTVPVAVTPSQPLHNHGTGVVTTSRPRFRGCDHFTTTFLVTTTVLWLWPLVAMIWGFLVTVGVPHEWPGLAVGVKTTYDITKHDNYWVVNEWSI